MNAVKHLVSKNKRRFMDYGYDLDLSYVTDDIIAMGYPSESMESMYRNSLDDVKRFLDDRHDGHYKVYNLCSERCYDVQKFHGRVAVYPFDDHQPPEFGQILPFCRDVQHWLSQHQENVAVIHCKAGKGRTGLMICAYLLFAGIFASADEVMQYYGSKRTFDSNGVTIPSQKRYVDYFSTKISHELQYSPVELLLKAIILEPPPHVGFGHHEAHLQFQVLQHFHESYQSEVQSVKWNDRKVEFMLDKPLSINGDIKVLFRQKMNVDLLHIRNKPKFISNVPHAKLFHFWVNTFFIDRKVSTELTHDIKNYVPEAKIKDKTPKQIPRNNTYSKNLSSFTIHNRFAALSLPDLQELNADNSKSLTEAVSSVENDEIDQDKTMMIQLSKHQIDKVSKDHTDRFPETFKVSLIVAHPDQLQEETSSVPTGIER